MSANAGRISPPPQLSMSRKKRSSRRKAMAFQIVGEEDTAGGIEGLLGERQACKFSCCIGISVIWGDTNMRSTFGSGI